MPAVIEPWLRATLPQIPPVQRAVIHALQLAEEDLARWCGPLAESELRAQPAGLPSLAFQIQHIARSIDRLLTYAEGLSLTDEQQEALVSETSSAPKEQLLAEVTTALRNAASRIQRIDSPLDEPRTVGRKKLPTTVAGLLIHIAEHTQRHVGQAITTAKVVEAARNSES